MDKLAIERGLNILRPASAHRAACRRNVSEAVVSVRNTIFFSATKRQLRSAAKKLTAARRALGDLNQFLEVSDSKFTRQLDRLTTALADMASSEGGGGRDRAVDYRRKYWAAQQALALLLRWSPRPPTLTEGGVYFELTAALYDAATDKEADEVVTACTAAIRDAKEDGYEPEKPEKYLRHLRAIWDITF